MLCLPKFFLKPILQRLWMGIILLKYKPERIKDTLQVIHIVHIVSAVNHKILCKASVVVQSVSLPSLWLSLYKKWSGLYSCICIISVSCLIFAKVYVKSVFYDFFWQSLCCPTLYWSLCWNLRVVHVLSSQKSQYSIGMTKLYPMVWAGLKQRLNPNISRASSNLVSSAQGADPNPPPLR